MGDFAFSAISFRGHSILFRRGLFAGALGTRGAVCDSLLKNDDVEIFGVGLATQRNDFEVNFARVAVGFDAYTLFADGLVVFLGLDQSFAKIYQQTLASHFGKAESGLTGGWFQVRSRLAAELDDFQGVIDDNAGRNEAIDEEPVHFLLDGNT